MLNPGAVILPALNHLLDGEEWARERLLPYGGQTARIDGGPLRLAMTVDERGFFRPAATDDAAA